MKLQYSFPTAFMSTEPPDWNVVEGGYAPRGAMGENRYLKTKKTSEDHSAYNLSSSEDVAEFGDILRISSTEPPDWSEAEGGYAPWGVVTKWLGWIGTTKKEKSSLTSLFLRYQAESNCCRRFCRPLPNHSAMVPIQDCKCSTNLSFCKLFLLWFQDILHQFHQNRPTCRYQYQVHL